MSLRAHPNLAQTSDLILLNTLAFTSTEVLVSFEFEIKNDTRSSAVIRLMQNTHDPSGTELSLNHTRHDIDRGHWSFKVMNELTEAGSCEKTSMISACSWATFKEK